MARIRTVKPEFWTSEQLAECSATARLLFIGVWTYADDQGVHPAAARQLKMEVFPGDDFTVDAIAGWITELRNAGLITQYESQGKVWWAVTGWHHQRIDKPTNKYPPPQVDDHSETVLRALSETSDSSRPVRESTVRESTVMESTVMEGKECSTESSDIEPKTKPKYSEAFEAWWSVYPRKVGRAKAFAAWKIAVKARPPDELLAITERYAKSPAGNAGQFTPHPATWLSQARYDDDPREWEKERSDGKPKHRTGEGQKHPADASDEVGVF